MGPSKIIIIIKQFYEDPCDYMLIIEWAKFILKISRKQADCRDHDM